MPVLLAAFVVKFTNREHVFLEQLLDHQNLGCSKARIFLSTIRCLREMVDHTDERNGE